LQENQAEILQKKILSIVNIATQCNQAISLKEIILMLPREFNEKEVLTIIQTNSNYKQTLTIENGFVVKKGYERLFSERAIREKNSRDSVKIAHLFFNKLGKQNSNVKLTAVCGSVAYGSASASDDIDLFIIARRNRLWLVFFKALLLARVFNIKAAINSEKTHFCLSYMQDENEFEKELQRKTPLMARELLSSIILSGIEVYEELLMKNMWIEDFFPRLAAHKLNSKEMNAAEVPVQDKSQSHVYDILNVVFFVGIGRFLLFKAFLRNLNYKKCLKRKDVFEAKITLSSVVYTSMRYRELEKMYQM
jgi:predicted nucleotidyltransferase